MLKPENLYNRANHGNTRKEGNTYAHTVHEPSADTYNRANHSGDIGSMLYQGRASLADAASANGQVENVYSVAQHNMPRSAESASQAEDGAVLKVGAYDYVKVNTAAATAGAGTGSSGAYEPVQANTTAAADVAEAAYLQPPARALADLDQPGAMLYSLMQAGTGNISGSGNIADAGSANAEPGPRPHALANGANDANDGPPTAPASVSYADGGMGADYARAAIMPTTAGSANMSDCNAPSPGGALPPPVQAEEMRVAASLNESASVEATSPAPASAPSGYPEQYEDALLSPQELELGQANSSQAPAPARGAYQNVQTHSRQQQQQQQQRESYQNVGDAGFASLPNTPGTATVQRMAMLAAVEFQNFESGDDGDATQGPARVAGSEGSNDGGGGGGGRVDRLAAVQGGRTASTAASTRRHKSRAVTLGTKTLLESTFTVILAGKKSGGKMWVVVSASMDGANGKLEIYESKGAVAKGMPKATIRRKNIITAERKKIKAKDAVVIADAQSRDAPTQAARTTTFLSDDGHLLADLQAFACSAAPSSSAESIL